MYKQLHIDTHYLKKIYSCLAIPKSAEKKKVICFLVGKDDLESNSTQDIISI